MTKIVIHPGLPKVASTSLQRDFFPNLNGVDFQGVYPFQYGKNVKNFEKFRSINHKIYRGKLDEAKKIVKKMLTDDINLFSNENWYTLSPFGQDDRFLLADRLHEIFPYAKIIIGIREKKFLLNSWYRQSVKSGYSHSFNAFMNKFCMSLLDYESYINYLKELYGNDRVFVYSMNDIVNNQEYILREMAKFMGVDAKRYFLGKSNIGYGKIEIILSIYFNKFFRTELNPDGLIPWNHILPHRFIFENLKLPKRKVDENFLKEKL